MKGGEKMELGQTINIQTASSVTNNLTESRINTDNVKDFTFIETLSKLLTIENGDFFAEKNKTKLLEERLAQGIFPVELLENINEKEAGIIEGFDHLDHNIFPITLQFLNQEKLVEIPEAIDMDSLKDLLLAGAKQEIPQDNSNLPNLLKKLGINLKNPEAFEKSPNLKSFFQEKDAQQIFTTENLVQNKIGSPTAKLEGSSLTGIMENTDLETERGSSDLVNRLILREEKSSDVSQRELKGLEKELTIKNFISTNSTSVEAQGNSTEGNNSMQQSFNKEQTFTNSLISTQLFSQVYEDGGISQVIKEPEVTPKELPNFILKQISNNLKFNKLTGSSELSIRLKPEELGKMTLQLLAQEGQVSIKIITESIRAREVIEHNLLHLKQTLANQGIKCTEIEVQVNTDSSFNEFMGQQHHHPFNHSRNKHNGKSNFIGAYDRNQLPIEEIGNQEGTTSSLNRSLDGLEFLA